MTRAVTRAVPSLVTRGRARAALLLFAVVAALLVAAPQARGQASPAFPSDDFNRSQLGAGWSVVDPVGDGSVALTGAGTGDAHLELSVPGGVNHDPWNANNSLRVVRAAADTDLTAIARFRSVPTQKYQMQGIVVQQDANTWLRFDVHFNGSNVRAFASSTAGGASTSRVNQPALTGASGVYLRVARQGDTWTLSTSADGASWRTAGSFSFAADVTQVGVFAGNNGLPGPAYTAVVDYLFEASAPIAAEDGVPTTTTTAPGTTTTTAPGTTTTTAPSTTTTAPTTTTTAPPGAGPSIDVWYGNRQVVGAHGQPQSAFNLLGRVTDPDGVAALSYTLNGGAPRTLKMGPDSRRLQNAGDFNADIPYSALAAGDNQVVLTARDRRGTVSTATVVLDRRSGGAPLPYATNWASASTVGDRAQVVDGRWGLDGATLRPVEMGYDRLVAIGDTSWHDYEVTFPVTVHGLGPGNGSWLSGRSLVGFGLNWRGHTAAGNEQPPYNWYPTGAFGWYRYYDTPRFELRGNGDSPIVRHQRSSMAFGQTYMFKARSDTVAGGVQYSWKVWPVGSPEPAGWDLTLLEPDGPTSGSLVLIAHHADVQFGNVTVTSVP